VIALEKENRQLLKRITLLEQENQTLHQQLQDLQMQLVQLQALVFKKKRLPPDDTDDDAPSSAPHPRNTRSAASYRRAVPASHEITHTEDHSLEQCTQCGSTQLETLDTRSLYVEDIPAVTKEVIHHRIYLYHCVACGQQQSSVPIPKGQQVILGPRVKARILYLSYILHCTDTDIIRYLWSTYQLHISPGEIHVIHKQSANRLRATYHRIKDHLNQQETTHLDETGWQVGREKHYAWGRVSPTTPELLIRIGTRGKNNAEEILQGFSGCLTTDCYAAYKHLPGVEHQVCWVHILREATEVADSSYLTDEQKTSAQEFHHHLQQIYYDLKNVLAQPFDQEQRTTHQQTFQHQLSRVNQLLPCDTPKKLKNIKLRTQEYAQELFTCLNYQTALPENNLAERALRHLVLKRKRSFGSATTQGANIFAINFSVIYSLWKKFPNSFFPALQTALVDDTVYF
jgi:transposase